MCCFIDTQTITPIKVDKIINWRNAEKEA